MWSELRLKLLHLLMLFRMSVPLVLFFLIQIHIQSNQGYFSLHVIPCFTPFHFLGGGHKSSIVVQSSEVRWYVRLEHLAIYIYERSTCRYVRLLDLHVLHDHRGLMFAPYFYVFEKMSLNCGLQKLEEF